MKLNLDLGQTFNVYLNLGTRQDRRAEAEWQFYSQRLTVVRQPGIKSAWVRDARGYPTAARYACGLGKCLAFRRGRKSGAEAVVFFEDDVVLDSNFRSKLAAIELPDDWGILYLGCMHVARPTPVAEGLVSVVQAVDMHAVVVRQCYLTQVISAMRGLGRGSPQTRIASDVEFSKLAEHIPSYACFPNLAWQAVSASSIINRTYSNYDKEGMQLWRKENVSGLVEEMPNYVAANTPEISPAAASPAEPKPVLSGTDTPPESSFYHFETKKRCVDEDFPLRLYVNLGPREDRRNDTQYEFWMQRMEAERFPAINAKWVNNMRGHKGKAQYACALSHRLCLRRGRQQGVKAVMIFEDDVQLDPNFRIKLEALELPEDWGILLLGCQHVEKPTVVLPGIVKVNYAFSLHAYLVKAEWIPTLLRAMRTRNVEGRQAECDVIVSQLTHQIPTYAVYPNIAWQRPSHSDIMGMSRKPYRDDGSQDRYRNVLRDTNVEMTQCIARRFGGAVAHGWQPPGDGLLDIQRILLTGARFDLNTLFPEIFYLNLNSREDRRHQIENELAHAGIAAERFTAIVGKNAIRLHGHKGHGEYGCYLSHRLMLRKALKRKSSAVMIVEDDALLHPDFRSIMERLDVPLDWGLLYFGCQHMESPQVVGPGIVRVNRAYSTHAYGVNAWAIPIILKVLRQRQRSADRTLPLDVILADLHREIPTYAVFPNLAWQAPGSSDIQGKDTSSYNPDGSQRWNGNHTEVVTREMRDCLESIQTKQLPWCDLCECEVAKFTPFGNPLRPYARCVRCGSLDRHRLAWRFLQSQYPNRLHGHKTLHFAPEACLERHLRSWCGDGYVSADLEMSRAMVKCDIQNLPMPDQTFDLLLCSHVLEHIPDDRRAMAEIRRVLKPGGYALVMVPLKNGATYEDDSITTRAGRLQHFNQVDHVRWYGEDLVDRLAAAGFEVQAIRPAVELSVEEQLRFGLIDEIIFWCRAN